jgi:hypothetical protein
MSPTAKAQGSGFRTLSCLGSDVAMLKVHGPWERPISTALKLAAGPLRNEPARASLERRMTAVFDELGLTELATSITGLSAVGAAAILAETGDPARLAIDQALASHAGQAPGRSVRKESPPHRESYTRAVRSQQTTGPDACPLGPFQHNQAAMSDQMSLARPTALQHAGQDCDASRIHRVRRLT